MIAVRCPRDYDAVMRKAGGQWEPGSRQWLIERRRINPVIRTLQRTADPLFRRVGIRTERRTDWNANAATWLGGGQRVLHVAFHDQ